MTYTILLRYMKKRKIFLIEDNKTEGLLLKLALNSIENIEVNTFTNGHDLIENIQENPDIALVDIMLPDISGFEIIKIIREYNPAIKIIVVSAQKDIELIGKLQSMGIYNYIVKSEYAIQYLKEVLNDLFIILTSEEQNVKS